MDFVSKPVMIVMAILIIVMAGYIAYLSVVNATQKTDLTIAKADLAVFTQANKEMKTSLDKQESAMKDLRAQTAARAKERDEAKKRASVISDKLVALAKQNAAAKPVSQDECVNGKAITKRYIRGLK